jgi:hypothetical protein
MGARMQTAPPMVSKVQRGGCPGHTGVRYDGMKTPYFETPLVTFLCVAIALLLAVTQPVFVLVFSLLIPFWFFLADVVGIPIPCFRQVRRAFPILVPSVFSPRPPPVR